MPKVFVTGAAGWIGTAVTKDLVAHGYEVIGLARSDASADIITKNGGKPHKGDLEDLASLKSGASASDGVLHLAFVHDFSNFSKACDIDQAAIKTMGEALAGTNKPLIICSGTLGYPGGSVANENTEPERGHPLSKRAESGDLVKKLSKEIGIRGQIVTLTPTCHGRGDGGFIPIMIDAAKKNGFATLVGDGSNVWPATHRDDVAVLFRLALEKGKAGANYNAVAEEGVRMKDVAAVIEKKLGIKAESKTIPEAQQALGFLGPLVSLNNPVSSELTKKELGWQPTALGLLADMEENYFIPGAKSKYA